MATTTAAVVRHGMAVDEVRMQEAEVIELSAARNC